MRQIRRQSFPWLLAVVLAMSAGAPRGQQSRLWRSYDWLLMCSAGVTQALGDRCVDGVMTVRNAHGIATTLAAASQWLDELGFRGPRLSEQMAPSAHIENASAEVEQDPRCAERYCAWLMNLPPGIRGQVLARGLQPGHRPESTGGLRVYRRPRVIPRGAGRLPGHERCTRR